MRRRVKKFEHGRSSGGGRGGYAPARRDRAPFPSQRLNVDVSLRHYFFPFPFLFFSFLSFSSPPPPPLVEIPRGAHSIIRYLCRTRQERPVARKATVQETLTPFRSSSPVTLPHPSSPLPLIAVLPRPTSQTLRFFPRVTRFRSQNPIPRLNIYCPLRLINDTFLHPATS